MTDPRRIPARLRKPYSLKRSPLKRIGRIGLKRAVAMEAARKYYVEKFGDVASGQGPCQLCRMMVDFDLHHKLKRSQGGDERFGNLLALCRGHHQWVHSSRLIYETVKALDANIENGLGMRINWEAR